MFTSFPPYLPVVPCLKWAWPSGAPASSQGPQKRPLWPQTWSLQPRCLFSALTFLSLPFLSSFSLPELSWLCAPLLRASTQGHFLKSTVISFLLLLKLQPPNTYHSELSPGLAPAPLLHLWGTPQLVYHISTTPDSPFFRSEPTCASHRPHCYKPTSWENWGLVTRLHLPFSTSKSFCDVTCFLFLLSCGCIFF